MSSKRRRFSGELKAKVALEALRGDRMLQEIASQHQVHPNQVSAWKRQAMEGLAEVFSKGAERRVRDHESEVRDLHTKIGELIVERDFLLRGSGRISRPERRAMVVHNHPALSLRRQCRLLSIGHSSLDYKPKGESTETLALMGRIDELFPKFPCLRRSSDGASSALRGRAAMDRCSGGRSDQPSSECRKRDSRARRCDAR